MCVYVCTANMRSIDEADRQTNLRLGQLAKNKANFTFQLRIKQLSIQAVTPESMAKTKKRRGRWSQRRRRQIIFVVVKCETMSSEEVPGKTFSHDLPSHDPCPCLCLCPCHCPCFPHSSCPCTCHDSCCACWRIALWQP